MDMTITTDLGLRASPSQLMRSAVSEGAAIEAVKVLQNIVLSLRNDVLKPGVDYGVIPGTGTKDTLLLPGMEKLMRALRLRPEYALVTSIQDFDKPLFHYRYECRMIEVDSGACVYTAIGSANSMESKWRWREAKRLCPKCQTAAINRSKFAPRSNPKAEPGWYCYAKAGGCGAEFAADDPAIISQQTGRMENPDIFDQINTIDKIAQKRSLSSAIKGVANVSEYFTVDLEDLYRFDTDVMEAEFVEVPLARVEPSTGEIVETPVVTPPSTPKALNGGGKSTRLVNPPTPPVEPHLPPSEGQEIPPTESTPETKTTPIPPPVDPDSAWTDAKAQAFADNLLSRWAIFPDDADSLAAKYRASHPSDMTEALRAAYRELAQDTTDMLAQRLTYAALPNGGGKITFHSAYDLEYYEGRKTLAMMLGNADMEALIGLQDGPLTLVKPVRITWQTSKRKNGEEYRQALKISWATADDSGAVEE